jgi:hypothetical protein
MREQSTECVNASLTAVVPGTRDVAQKWLIKYLRIGIWVPNVHVEAVAFEALTIRAGSRV